jgi:hypothetical protein
LTDISLAFFIISCLPGDANSLYICFSYVKRYLMYIFLCCSSVLDRPVELVKDLAMPERKPERMYETLAAKQAALHDSTARMENLMRMIRVRSRSFVSGHFVPAHSAVDFTKCNFPTYHFSRLVYLFGLLTWYLYCCCSSTSKQ